MIIEKSSNTIKHSSFEMHNLRYRPISKKSKQISKPIFSLKKHSIYWIGIFISIGLMNAPITAFAGIFSGDYNPYMGLSPFEQCMIYLGGDENIEEELNEDLYGCGEKWGIDEHP